MAAAAHTGQVLKVLEAKNIYLVNQVYCFKKCINMISPLARGLMARATVSLNYT